MLSLALTVGEAEKSFARIQETVLFLLMHPLVDDLPQQVSRKLDAEGSEGVP